MVAQLLRSLAVERIRVLLSVLAVAAATVVVIALEGFRVGLWHQVSAYWEGLSVEFIGTGAGLAGTLQTRTVFPAGTVGEVLSVPGVRQVHPLVSVPAIFVQNGRETPITVIGYEKAGGPRRLARGRPASGPGEVVMDYALARMHRLSVGNRVALFGRDFEIVGLSADTTSLVGSYVFMGLEDASSLLFGRRIGAGNGGNPNLLLIELEPGFDPASVKDAVERAAPAVQLLTPAEVATRNVDMLREVMDPALKLMIGVAYVVGLLVIGLTLYSAVFERLPEYAIIKAVGASNARLHEYVTAQALVFGTLGFVVAGAASAGVAALISWQAPQYLVVPWDARVLLRSGVAVLVMATLASLLPMRQVATVDPAMVFRR